MDPIKALRYRFTRYCVNRAYVNIDLSNKSAEFINFLDDLVEDIRDLEKVLEEDPSKIDEIFTVTLLEKFNELKERDREVAKAFFSNILRNCLDLEEVAESPLGRTIYELLAKIEQS
ncbi:hypothetical protein [Thermoproteus tenax]|uniref:Uncharacterized protein n=1 Tax=Thermoproteus tenax (strain ATCC 35583 / DSM 2078 / JCM 9277 / NBRC 100435 / Kra 1) TaxID=768679 RepID=G4RNV6_THETK|nr:hypothetical protein [Thermoproteus tenax]CCC81250.1 hypothetical protein TTX_0586 [Thermoproteus tenax Kra 1]